MEVPAQQSNLRTNQEDERIELDELLHTTNKISESDETTPTKRTGQAAESAPVVEAPTIIEIDSESHAQKDSDEGNSDDQSCCTGGK